MALAACTPAIMYMPVNYWPERVKFDNNWPCLCYEIHFRGADVKLPYSYIP